MGVMDNAVQDCIGNSGIGHGLIPVIQGELAGKDRGAGVAAVVNDV